MAITHLLLDIEGTTCPVSFVAEELFPYARAALPEYLARHGDDAEVAALGTRRPRPCATAIRQPMHDPWLSG